MIQKIKFPIVKNFKYFALFSALLAITGLVSLILLPFGVNLFSMDIDFAGGTMMHVDLKQEMDGDAQQELTALLEGELGITVSSMQRTGEGTEVIIKTVDLDTNQRTELVELLKTEYGIAQEDVLEMNNVNPSVGKEMQRTAFTAALLAAVLMMIYIAFRFELTSGLAAVTTLLHDILVMLSFYVIFGIQLNLNFIAAALTVLGYSINSSIIVFDRIRENRRTSKKEIFENTVERSIWQTIVRNINTTMTTVFIVGMVYVFGVPSLRNFTLPLLIGMIAGGYSSVFLAGSLWGIYRKAFNKKRK